MNKIVCNVCGTSYPENSTQCPICGYVQTSENAASAKSVEGSYTYVKGGRFSKANVKKRNQAKQSNVQAPAPRSKPASSKKKKKNNVGSIIVIVVLMLAIIAVIGYITLRFFLPNNFLFEGLDNLKLPDAVQQVEQTESTEPMITQAPTPDPVVEPEVSLDCTAILLDADVIQLEGVDSTAKLAVTLEPAETPDVVSYTSSDESVATVSDDGTITVTGEGTAVITVTCGSVSTECSVICTVKEDLVLNRKEITFDAQDQSWLIYDGEIPVEEIVWTSDDNNVATVESGKVVAVGEGDTIVYALYDDQKVACVIHCDFDKETQVETGAVSEADGNSQKTYTLYNPYGNADDATLNVGEQFTLRLVDENLKDASAVEWKVKNENVCTFTDNIVKAVSSGTTEITATCEGKTYTCIVRVK